MSNEYTCKINLKAQEEYPVSLKVVEYPITLKVEDEDLISFTVEDEGSFHFTIEEEPSVSMKVYEGTFSDTPDPDYEGPYIVVPKRNEQQTLNTKNKRMTDDVSVVKIPEYQVRNNFGTTFIIGGDQNGN